MKLEVMCNISSLLQSSAKVRVLPNIALIPGGGVKTAAAAATARLDFLAH